MKLYEFFGVPTWENNNQNDSQSKMKVDDQKLEDEVYWFILDHDDLHKEHFIPLAHKINKLQKSNKFDHSKFIEAWMPMVNKGCLEYYKKQQMTEDPKDLFSKDMRKSLCQRLATQHHEDIEKGEYKL